MAWLTVSQPRRITATILRISLLLSVSVHTGSSAFKSLAQQKHITLYECMCLYIFVCVQLYVCEQKIVVKENSVSKYAEATKDQVCLQNLFRTFLKDMTAYIEDCIFILLLSFASFEIIFFGKSFCFFSVQFLLVLRYSVSFCRHLRSVISLFCIAHTFYWWWIERFVDFGNNYCHGWQS